MATVPYNSANTNRGVLLNSSGDAWNGSVYASIPASGAWPVNMLLTPVQSGAMERWIYTIPVAAETVAWTLVVFDDAAPDVDSLITFESTVAKFDTEATEAAKQLVPLIEAYRGSHQHQTTGSIFFVSSVNGASHASGNRGGMDDPYLSVQDCHDNAVVSNRHDLIILLADNLSGVTVIDEQATLSKEYLSIRGPGRSLDWKSTSNGNTITVTGAGVSLEGFQLNTHTGGNGIGIVGTGADFLRINHVWVNDTRSDGIQLTNCDNLIIEECNFQRTGQLGSGNAISIIADGTEVSYGRIKENYIEDIPSDGIRLSTSSGGVIQGLHIQSNHLFKCVGVALDIIDSNVIDTVFQENTLVNNTIDMDDNGTNTTVISAVGGLTALETQTIVETAFDDKKSDGTLPPTDGSLVVIASNVGDGQPISSAIILEGHTWRFEHLSQLTATPIIRESLTFNSLLSMDFDTPLSNESSIFSIALVHSIPVTDLVFGVLKVSTNRRAAHINIQALNIGTYTIGIAVTTTDSQIFTRKGILVIE